VAVRVGVAVGGVPVGVKVTQAKFTQAAPATGAQMPQSAAGACAQKSPQSQHARTVGAAVGVRVTVGVTVGVNVAHALPLTQTASGTGAQLPQLPTGSCAQNVPQLQHPRTVGVAVLVRVAVPVGVAVGVLVNVRVGLVVGVGVGVLVAVGVGVGVCVRVGVAVEVGVGVLVDVGVGVLVRVGVAVGVAVAVFVGVGVLVAVLVAVGVTVGVKAAHALPPAQDDP
jgi:hypothetical protein